MCESWVDGAFFFCFIMTAGVTEESLKALFIEKLAATHVQVIDESGGCGQMFKVVIVSDAFVGKSLLQRHRLVNSCAAEEIKQLHAFSQVNTEPFMEMNARTS